MKGVRDWIFSQIVSKSVVSSRSMSGTDRFFDEEPLVEESDGQGETHPSTLVPEAVQQALLCSSDDNHERELQTSSQQVIIDLSDNSHHYSNGKKSDPLLKIEDLQVKFLRLLRRLGLPQNSILVAKVLYRIHLATLIRAEESDLKRINPRSDTARGKAEQQEALNLPELDFSIRILVLGKTGVGKSATINSIFDQTKTVTDPFRPATDRIQEIEGSINGLRLTIVDTPGFLPPSAINDKRNKKILLSVKRFIQRSPPDIVLYFDRLDLFGMIGYNDAPLLKLITEVFGPGIWFNTILVMTHSSSPLPEGLEGFPVNYESYVARCSDMAQRNIHQAVSDTKLENPVLLVENHPHCKRNSAGEKILPNGQVWRSELLLLCICTKVLSDVNIILKLQKSIELGPPRPTRVPLLPHLLSSMLRRRQIATPNGSEIDESLFTESELDEKEDEYDKLLPIRIQTKSQFQRLSKSQKKEYLDELDYRETLYLKKQLKEEYRRRRAKKGKKAATDDSISPDGHEEDDISLPDVAIPASFDSNFPIHRYRAVVSTSDQWVVRPTLETQGWDRDVGFDGISFETAKEISDELCASVAGQFSKDKQGFSIQSECAGSYSGPGRASYSAGLDVQSAGDDLMCTFHGGSRLRNVRHNTVDCGVSLTSLGDKVYFGAKIEDAVSVGKRLRFMANAGRLGGGEGRVAYGGNFEATLRGRDYPVRADSISLLMTVLSFDKETVLGGNLKTEFRVNRSLKMSVNASLNTRKCGQICVKTSSSEHLHIALVALFTMVKAFSRRKGSKSLEEEY